MRINVEGGVEIVKAQESCVFTEDYYCTESCESVKIDQDVLPREFDSLFVCLERNKNV